MTLAFSKMHGLGNDFIVIDAINQQIKLTATQIAFLADRRRGIGFDQLLLVQQSNQSGIDFGYRIFNADGSKAQQCGNGARCFARFVRDKKLTDKDVITVATSSVMMTLSIQVNGDVKVDMGIPQFKADSVPFITDHEANSYDIAIADGSTMNISVLFMGNPHAVTIVDDVDQIDVASLGAMLQHHPQFPERVNVSFMAVISRSHIRLRVYERGVGETQACGSAACAAVVIGIQRGLLARKVDVDLPGGRLLVSWPDTVSPVWMQGPAAQVFDGEIAWATIRSQ